MRERRIETLRGMQAFFFLGKGSTCIINLVLELVFLFICSGVGKVGLGRLLA